MQKSFLYKLINWEFWPWQLIYSPIMLYWLWLSLKARSLFFFFAVNPGIESGGLLIESKIAILKLIPEKYIPRTILFEHPCSFNEVIDKINSGNIRFPVIVKPNYGERGRLVEKIEDSQELKRYLTRLKINFLIQEYVDLPVELGIFYFRYPDNKKGTISSVVLKELLYVTGDGQSTVKMLIKANPRAFFPFL